MRPDGGLPGPSVRSRRVQVPGGDRHAAPDPRFLATATRMPEPRRTAFVEAAVPLVVRGLHAGG